MLQTPTVQRRHQPAPVADFARFRQTWAEIGLTTLPANRGAAEAAVQKVYKTAGLDAPAKIVWCSSPFSLALARAVSIDPGFLECVIAEVWAHVKKSNGSGLKDNIADSFRSSMRLFDTAAVKQELADAVKKSVAAKMTQRLTEGMKEHIRPSVLGSVWESTWNSVWDGTWSCIWHGIESGLRKAIEAQDNSLMDQSVTNSLKDWVGDAVKTAIWEKAMDQSWANIRNSAGSKIRVAAWNDLWCVLQASIWENVALPIGECVKAGGNNSTQASCYGQHDAYWQAFYAYFREKENLVAETEPVSGLLDIAQSAGWFVPHTRICWISERPLKLSLNPDNKLHASDGPAVVYPDGWSVYARDGVLHFPQQGMPDSVSAPVTN
ncbi:MAG: putative rane protein [Burkholderia sp.]|nr:putative rane protein [Burkholderia sp.]